MKASPYQFVMARSVMLAGALVALTLPAFYFGPSLPVLHIDQTTVTAVRYLLTTWALPAAVSLMLGGYLLRPPYRSLPPTRLYVPLRIGMAVLLWLLGMLCLLAPILLALAQGVRFIRSGVALPPWHLTVLEIYLLHIAFFPTGLLFLLAARKWLYDTERPV